MFLRVWLLEVLSRPWEVLPVQDEQCLGLGSLCAALEAPAVAAARSRNYCDSTLEAGETQRTGLLWKRKLISVSC